MAAGTTTGDVYNNAFSAPRLEPLVDEAEPKVFWTDRLGGPRLDGRASGRLTADLVVIGAGFTGLWTALAAAEEDPGRSIIVLEAETIGRGASTRNGGFCDASLTHGLANGVTHWPDEIDTLLRLGDENLAGLLADAERLGFGDSAHRRDVLDVAVTERQSQHLEEQLRLQRRHGRDCELLQGSALEARLRSPLYCSGLVIEGTLALIDPGRMTWGLAKAVADAGVRIHERTSVDGVEPDGSRLAVHFEGGSVSARRVVVATNAWAGPRRTMRRRIVPVYDHVLMTEPLPADRLAELGWQGREGVSDVGRQFHYYRLTDDDRILWGGYDANYYYGSGVKRAHERRLDSHYLLAQHFFQTFPSLDGIRFTHRWAGPIGTTARFTAAWGTELDGRLAWVGGYTGLGVGASRFGARVALDLVDGEQTERTELAMVRSKPFPLPPEPLRWLAIKLTRRAIVKSDRDGGREPLLLKVLDRFGIGFDS